MTATPTEPPRVMTADGHIGAAEELIGVLHHAGTDAVPGDWRVTLATLHLMAAQAITASDESKRNHQMRLDTKASTAAMNDLLDRALPPRDDPLAA